MKNKFLFLFVFTLLIFTFMLPFLSSYFTKSHEYITLKAFQNVDSAITRECRDHIQVVLDGNTGTDVSVLKYFTSSRTSYIGTHQRGSGYQECLRIAGSEKDKNGVPQRCFCYGISLHQTQDALSHLKEGIVAKNLAKWKALNFYGHMVIERNFEMQHLKLVANDPIVSSGTLTFYDERVLDTLFDETGGDSVYMSILNEAAELDLTNDAKLFRSGYLGTGFVDTVYTNKIQVPMQFALLAIILSLLGLGIPIIALFTGKTGWKWVILLIWLPLAAFGILILVSYFILGNTWQITLFLTEIPPKFGYLSIPKQDIEFYNQKLLENTEQFLRGDGELLTDDASGLSYVDRFGNKVPGALTEAEKLVKNLFLFVGVPLFALLNLILFRKAYGLKGIPFWRRRKR